MIVERHNTHILSNSSEDEVNNIEKTSLEVMLSRQKEVENQNIQGIHKINIKDLFKNIEEREINKIIYFDESDEGNEEEKNVDKEILDYYKNVNKKKDHRKNISQNIKDCLIKKKTIELLTEQIEKESESNKKKRN